MEQRDSKSRYFTGLERLRLQPGKVYRTALKIRNYWRKAKPYNVSNVEK